MDEEIGKIDVYFYKYFWADRGKIEQILKQQEILGRFFTFIRNDIVIRRDNTEKVFKCLNQILHDDPYFKEVWVLKGITFARLKMYEDAIKCFNIALEIDSRYIDAWHQKGSTYNELYFHEEAIRCFDEILAINRTAVEALNNKAYALARPGSFEEAVACLNSGIELNPQEGVFYYNIACIESLRNVRTESLRALKRAIECNLDFRRVAKWDPDFTNIAELEDFHQLIERSKSVSFDVNDTNNF